jgi:Kef-type K+ transport system membrane component KefB
VDFAALALIALVGIAGPLLSVPVRWNLPVVLGELLAGVVLGDTGSHTLHPDNATFSFLAQVGFALVMFVAGSHVPIRNGDLRPALRVGVLRALAVGVLSVGAGYAVSAMFGTGHPAIYAVLLASSSAALVLPIVDSLRLSGEPVVALLAQVAIADAACIVALPLVIDPQHARRAALGAAAVVAAAIGLFLLLRQLEVSGYRKRMHKLSEERRFALELRINLLIVFALAALAVRTHVSIMLAGFSFGLVMAAIGAPRRLNRQLFAIADGFLGPLFFVWLGASLDIRALGSHRSYILLGLALGVGAVLTHVVMRLLGQAVPMGLLAAGQLGVPVAAATLGTHQHLLHPGEPAALLLGAMVTVVAAALAGAAVARRQAAAPAAASAGPPSGARDPGEQRPSGGPSR